MKKFDGGIFKLSVIRCATYSPAFLNRQVILLLSNLGVPDEVFEAKNENALQKLNIRKTLLRLYNQIKEIRKIKLYDIHIKSVKE